MERPLSEPLIPDDFSPSKGESRPRDSLFLMARFRTPSLSRELQVRIRNLSAGGLMAEVELPLERGDPVEVEVRGLGWVPGRVAWCAEGRTGVAFNREIDPRRARKPVGAAVAKGFQPGG